MRPSIVSEICQCVWMSESWIDAGAATAYYEMFYIDSLLLTYSVHAINRCKQKMLVRINCSESGIEIPWFSIAEFHQQSIWQK